MVAQHHELIQYVHLRTKSKFRTVFDNIIMSDRCQNKLTSHIRWLTSEIPNFPLL